MVDNIRQSLWDRAIDKFTIGSGCWIWHGAKETAGYGSISRGHRVEGRARAHRLIYEWLVGPIPASLDLDHLCRVPACVNPDHLEPVTHAENMRRQPRPDACPRGHAFMPENTQRARTGNKGRKCRACFAYFTEQARVRRQSLRAARA